MHGLTRVKSVLEFNEKDRDQGVERNYLYYTSDSSHVNTEKQEADIINSTYWKKMLFLDGTLQSTLRDEVIYHNALVHPLMDTLQTKDHILILGGGEGATAREVLRWSKVKGVMMVDYDKELVEFMKYYGPEWSMGAFHDPRLTVLFHDAWAFVKTGLEYDGVIIDLTDPDLVVTFICIVGCNFYDRTTLNLVWRENAKLDTHDRFNFRRGRHLCGYVCSFLSREITSIFVARENLRFRLTIVKLYLV